MDPEIIEPSTHEDDTVPMSLPDDDVDWGLGWMI